MSYNIKGKVYQVGATEQINDKLSKRKLVIETNDNPKYPQLVELEAVGERCALLDGVATGEMISIDFDIRGREWRKPGGDAKFFVSLNVWKLERAGQSQSRGGSHEPAPSGYGGSGSSGQDDIPL